MTQKQKNKKATREMTKFDLWMRKMKNIHYGHAPSMSVAYEKVFNVGLMDVPTGNFSL